jgi:hypothetical protein
MNTFLKDFQEVTINTLDNFHEFIDEREKTDVWTEPFIEELQVVGIPLDSPILIQDLLSQLPHPEVDEVQLEEAMNPEYGEMGLLLTCPDTTGTNNGTYPLRYTAISPLLERAGLGGRSIRNVEAKNNYDTLDPAVKANMISTCLKLYPERCKMLFRDKKVATVRSCKYEVLNASDLLNELETALSVEWADFEFVDALINHEYLSADFLLHDESAEKTIKDILNGTCVDNKDWKIGITFVTSDVGNSTAKINPFLCTVSDDGKIISRMPFGNGVGMKHSTGASLEKWTSGILPKVLPMIADIENVLDKMADTKIKNPGGCLRHLAMTLHLPKQISLDIAEEFDNSYMTCTAIDVYCQMFEIVSMFEKQLNSKQQLVTPSTKLRYTDAVATSVFVDYKEHDYDFEWA